MSRDSKQEPRWIPSTVICYIVYTVINGTQDCNQSSDVARYSGGQYNAQMHAYIDGMM